MKLTSIEARKLLEIERQKTKDDRWIDHCLCVGNSAGRIAEALNKTAVGQLEVIAYDGELQ